MNDFIKVQNKVVQLREYSLYNVSIVPFSSRLEIEEHVKMMEKMNES